MTKIVVFCLFLSVSTNLRASDKCSDYLRMLLKGSNSTQKALSKTINYSYERAGQKNIQLPAILEFLKDNPKLKIISLAGNFHPEYENTRHNISFRFWDYFFNLNILNLAPLRKDSLKIQAEPASFTANFDDGTEKTFKTTFFTEEGYTRTRNGEVFYYPSLFGEPVIFVKPLGDYNEGGDFTVAILNYLNLSSKNLLHIFDDLDVPLNTSEIKINIVQKYTGNNSLFSLIRNISFSMPEIVAQTLNENGVELSEEAYKAFVDQYYRMAIIRAHGHLGDEKIYNNALKNINAIMGTVQSSLKPYLLNVPKKERPDLIAKIEAAVKEELIFSNLSIGIKEGERPSVEELGHFVLSAPSENFHTETSFTETAAKVEEWIKNK